MPAQFTYSSRPITIGELADLIRAQTQNDWTALLRLLHARTEPRVTRTQVRDVLAQDISEEISAMMEGLSMAAELTKLSQMWKKGK